MMHCMFSCHYRCILFQSPVSDCSNIETIFQINFDKGGREEFEGLLSITKMSHCFAAHLCPDFQLNYKGQETVNNRNNRKWVALGQALGKIKFDAWPCHLGQHIAPFCEANLQKRPVVRG